MAFNLSLTKKKKILTQKSKDIPREALYYKMLEETIEALIALDARIEMLKQTPFTKAPFKPYEAEWEEIMVAIEEAFDLLVETPYKVVKGKRIYEDVDTIFADLEDWMESLNEEAFMEMEPLGYIENWDIGLFF